MSKLLVIIFLLISLSTYSQDIGETIEWLKENIGTTIRDGKLQYECQFAFSEKGVRIIGGRNASFLSWDRIQGLATTERDKVYLAFSGTSYGGKQESYFEYITPKDGISAQSVLNRVAVLCKNAGNNQIKFWNFLLGDADETHHRIVAEAQRRQEENPNNLTEAELAKQKATLEAFDAISVLLGDYWEFSGSISTFTYEIGPLGYNPIKKYDPTDARLTIVYGEKNLTFNLGMGLTWIDLPSYRKYNTSGTELKYTDFGTVRYLSPSAGLTYKFMSKENKEDFFRDFEFPLTVSFAPLFSPNSDDVSIKSQAFDTPFDKYFDGLSYNINASLGANIYFGKGIGLGLSGGVTYVNINGTTSKLTETDSNNRQNDFTIKFDKLSRIVPRVELKLILRN